MQKRTHNITKLPTEIFGLVYRPSINAQADQQDNFGFSHGPPPEEFSACNRAILKDELLRMGESCKCILEIGVCRNGEKSSSHILIDYKPKDCVYLGVDLDDKSFLNDPENNVHTIQTNSGNHGDVLNRLAELGVGQIDFFFIDGWHSVNQVLLDWMYVNFLSNYGVVGFHDINEHPPFIVFDAIDDTLFDKMKYCETGLDWGIGFARRKDV